MVDMAAQKRGIQMSTDKTMNGIRGSSSKDMNFSIALVLSVFIWVHLCQKAV
jgi:hypothetical protein